MFIIGIDPHKGSHTAAVLDDSEKLVGELRVVADRRQRDRLLRFAAPFEPRTWAVEAAGGLGALLAQQLVAAGETVLDVPPTLSARARLLDSGRTDKSDPHDARSAAVVALRHDRLRTFGRSITPRCCACWRTAATTSPRCGPGPSAGSTPCCACSAPAAAAPVGADGPPRCCGASARSSPSPSNASAWPSSSSPMCAASTSSSTASASASPTPSPRRAPPSPRSTAIGPILRRGHRRPHRSRRSVPDRRALRPLQRHRPHRSVQRAHGPSPAQPPREPTPQPRPAHRGGHPDRARHPRPRLLRPQDRRGQDPQRSPPRPQAPHQRRRLPPAPRRHPALIQKGPGGQAGTTPKASVTGSAP